MPDRTPWARTHHADQTRLLRAITDNADVALFIMDERQQCVFMNPAAEALTGFTLADVAGRPLHDVIHHTRPDGRPYPLSECPIDQAFPTRNRMKGEEVFVHRTGRFYDVAFTASPIRDESGAPIGTVIEVQDVTGRKRVENALRESEGRFRTMADTSPVMIWVTDARGNVEFVNRAYLTFFAIAESELRGERKWQPLVHPDDVEAYTAPFLGAVAGHGAFSAECRVKRADGTWRWIASYAAPRFSDSGEFLGHVGSSFDISDRKRAEEALLEADRRKDEFLAVLAHELRNPLAPIRTGLELLRISSDPAAAERARTVMERQVTHMVRLVDDLLDVSRITSGRIELQRTPTPVAELVQHAVDAHRGAIDAAGLTITVDLPDVPVVLDVDPTRFVQVLSNLLSNAVKFTDAPGSIAIRAAVESGGELAIAVSDTGIGIASESLSRVFDLFVQGESGARRAGGLGIGLALARQLIEMHGGRLEGHSPGAGRGSTFTIRIPVVADSRVGDVRRRDSPVPARKRVLVVDDNVDAAEMLGILIEALGGEALTAHDGASAISRAGAFRPEIILLDIGMPGIDGYETCRRLRLDPVTSSAYIAALTGWGQQQDKERALAAGFDAHITKPAAPEVLEALLADERPRARSG